MFHLKRNLPHWERALRLGSAALVTYAALSGYTQGFMTWAAYGTAATLVLTAFVGFCPACAMVGRRYLDN
ncbi:YgaP family membrane protein [Undibacterium flavidum]|uniref:DUF2892 domain-containing protein n=1 Tax=Undibacterium flavidum TaxID=2762297 RepID=A0ABR6Y7R5_9BURK|nr:DUF2892 domain-containing protein [Undibacterium flavidum]MBC3872646.1 DUF2892 domain-containing protein [Undibacterium flavidum]